MKLDGMQVGAGRPGSLDTKDLDRAGNALQCLLPERGQHEAVFDQGPRRVADDHRIGLGDRLDPSRHVRRRPDDIGQAALTRRQADDHRAAVDADADGSLDAEAPADVRADLEHALHDFQACEHRPLGVVAMRLGMPEAGEDAVALELQDLALQRIDRTGCRVAVDPEQVTHGLGFRFLGHGSGSHDVREQEGHHGSQATRESVLRPDSLKHLGSSLVFRRNREDIPEDLLGAVPRAVRQGLLSRCEQPVDEAHQPVVLGPIHAALGVGHASPSM